MATIFGRARVFSDFDVDVLKELAKPHLELFRLKGRETYGKKLEAWKSVYEKYMSTEGTSKVTLIQLRTKWLKVEYKKNDRRPARKTNKAETKAKTSKVNGSSEVKDDDSTNESANEKDNASETNNVSDNDEESKLGDDGDRLSEDDEDTMNYRSRFIRHGTPVPTKKIQISSICDNYLTALNRSKLFPEILKCYF
ncbi:hypothetical protein CHUAL_005787 [Chamberlinius hualienensis]